MSDNNKYSVLFEPVKIGPVTAPNCFYQVPHCCGMGHVRPQAHAAMRAMKAEGGWGVISTEKQVSIRALICRPIPNSSFGMNAISPHCA